MRSMLGQVLHSRLDLTKHTPSNNLYSDLAGGESFCIKDYSLIKIGDETGYVFVCVLVSCGPPVLGRTVVSVSCCL